VGAHWQGAPFYSDVPFNIHIDGQWRDQFVIALTNPRPVEPEI
jgi:hypothetical protein